MVTYPNEWNILEVDKPTKNNVDTTEIRPRFVVYCWQWNCISKLQRMDDSYGK